MKHKAKNTDMPANIPTTGRTPDFLAKRYGFSSLDQLIEDIPKNATVLDVGAGMSLLGHAVGTKRPDVAWFNIDPFYKNPRSLLASADAPLNVTYLSNDIVKLPIKLKNVKADRIYSYWMLPHLSVISDEPACKAVGAMWDMLAGNGKIYAGPDKPYRLSSLFRSKRVIKVSKKSDRESAVYILVAATRLPWWMRKFQYGANTRMRPVANLVLARIANSQMRRARQRIG